VSVTRCTRRARAPRHRQDRRVPAPHGEATSSFEHLTALFGEWSTAPRRVRHDTSFQKEEASRVPNPQRGASSRERVRRHPVEPRASPQPARRVAVNTKRSIVWRCPPVDALITRIGSVALVKLAVVDQGELTPPAGRQQNPPSGRFDDG
jgi:hypothetical protein